MDGDVIFDKLTALRDYATSLAGMAVNVRDYGATGNGSTDDRAAIQSAIDAVYAAGGGIVYFPAGVYVLSSALQTTAPTGSAAATYNAQLRIPYRSPSAADVSITLMGPTPAGPYLQFTSSPAPTSGAVLLSTVTGSGTKPAVIGGPRNDAVGYPNFSSLTLRVENLTVRTTNNPTLAGIDLEWVGKVELFGVAVDNGVNTYASQQPTNAAAVGVLLPNSSNNALVHLRNVYVAGYYCGVRSYEHTFWDNVAVQSCYRGVELGGAYHFNGGPRLLIQQCPYGLVAIGGGQNAGNHYLKLDHIDFEVGTNGTGPGGADISWMNNVATFSDAAGYLKGEATIHVTQAGVGVKYTSVNFVGANNFRVVRGDSQVVVNGPGRNYRRFAQDTFTEPNLAQNLTAHDPDIGGTWVKTSGVPGDLGVTTAGRCRLAGTAVDHRYTNSATPPSPDYRVSVDLVQVASRAGPEYPGLAGRCTAANTYYRAQFNHDGSHTLYLLKTVSGSETTLGTYTGFDPVVGIPFNLFLRMVGPTIVAGINGIDCVTATDSAITAAGKAGLTHYASSAGDVGESGGIQFDDFVAEAI